MGFQFTSPVGRWVSGDPFKATTTDKTGKPLTFSSGKNAGQPRSAYYISLALPKSNPQLRNFWEDAQYAELFHQMYNEARTGYSNLFNAQGACTHPQFAWKVQDGDGFDGDGKPNSTKPGHAGHWIVKFGSNFAPKVVMNGRYVENPADIKRGWFVRVAGDCSANIGSSKPGLYVNLSAMEIVAEGEEIKGGFDAVGAFGAAAPVALALPGMLPLGTASAGLMQQAVAPQQPQAMGVPGFTPPQAVGVPTTMPGVTTMAPPAAAVVPNHQFVHNAIGAPAAQAVAGAVPGMQAVAPAMSAPPALAMPALAMPTPPAQVALPTYTPTAAAQGHPLEVWLQQYTIEQLVAGGVFIKS